MWDLVRFDPAGCASAQMAHCIDVQKQPPSFFLSVPEIEPARHAAKRARHLHLSSCEPDIGVLRTAAQNSCTLVVAVSDFLDLPPDALAKRLARARALIRLALHYHARVKLCTLAKSEPELRGENELMAIGLLLGFTPEQMRAQNAEAAP